MPIAYRSSAIVQYSFRISLAFRPVFSQNDGIHFLSLLRITTFPQ
jgi:hypothetical protein